MMARVGIFAPRSLEQRRMRTGFLISDHNNFPKWGPYGAEDCALSTLTLIVL